MLCWDYNKEQKRILVEMRMIPFIHRKLGKPFYGWYIVGVAFLALFVSVGATIDALAVLLKPMTEGLDWTWTMMMGAITVASIATALTSPLVGRIIDRHGARVLMPLSAMVGGGLLIGLSSVTQIWQFYLLFGVGIGFVRSCFFFVAANTAVSNWFIRKRGRALAVSTMGTAISALVIIPLTQYVITTFGWRTAWVMLGIMTCILLALPAGLIVRRRPEDMGLLPDGDHDDYVEISKSPQTISDTNLRLTGAEVNWPAKQALRTRAFWFIMVSFILTALTIMGVWLHAAASFTDQGIYPAQAALAMGSVAATSFAAGCLLAALMMYFAKPPTPPPDSQIRI